MKAPVQQSGGNFEPAPAGNQVGIFYGIQHFGPQEFTYKGESKMRDEVRLMFELSNAKRKFGDDEEERPYTINKTGTYSMHEKAWMRKAVEACVGPMTDSEAEAFEVEKALGKPCLINVEHYTDRNGNQRAGIGSVTPLPEGMPVPDQVNKSVKFDVLHYTQEEFDALPEWAQEKVKASQFKPVQPDEEGKIDPSDIPF